MDPRAHRRFLEYRETVGYFRAEHRTMLGREEWVALDVELAAFEARPPREWSEEEALRVRTLKRVLLRD
jgi:hypothetical protein